jgi:hypothetical protein
MLERLREPLSDEIPNCVCKNPMKLDRVEAASADTQIKTFRCSHCERELLLTVWIDPA